MKRPALLYGVHSGLLYGTERMALATASGLQHAYRPVFLSPPGPLVGEARRRGFDALALRSDADFLRCAMSSLRRHAHVAACTTTMRQALMLEVVARLHPGRLRHIHVVHGGTNERDSYGRKHLLNRLPVEVVAVSDYVRERLLAHGVRAERVRVIPNWLDPRTAPRAVPRAHDRVGRVLVVSRADPIKRLDMVLDLLDRYASHRDLAFDVLGAGACLDALRARAERDHPNVRFLGYREDVHERLARADLLLHLCPEEPFGLSILEAMATGTPVLVPDRGGAASLVRPGRTGLRYCAGDVDDLAARLTEFVRLPSAERVRLAEAAHRRLDDEYTEAQGARRYGRALERAANLRRGQGYSRAPSVSEARGPAARRRRPTPAST